MTMTERDVHEPEPDWNRLLLEAIEKAVEDERFESHHREVAMDWEVLDRYEEHIKAGHSPRDSLFEAVYDEERDKEIVREVLGDELEARGDCPRCGGSGGGPEPHLKCPSCNGTGRA